LSRRADRGGHPPPKQRRVARHENSKVASSRRSRRRSAASTRSEDLGFSPGVCGETEYRHCDAFKKGKMSADVAIMAQRARVSPGESTQSSHRVAAVSKTTIVPLPHHAAPRHPHGRGTRPSPEPLVRLPINMTLTVQGHHPGVPALSTRELKGNGRHRYHGNHLRHPSGIGPKGRKILQQISDMEPPWLPVLPGLGRKSMGSRGPGTSARDLEMANHGCAAHHPT
jgi:hypothetical protein